MKKLFILTLIACCCSFTVFSKDYYVSKKGNDKSPGTKDAPFLSIQKAATVMKAGDVCHISSGVYSETITPENSGQKQNPIVFKPLSENDKVIITGAEPIPNKTWMRVSKNIFKAKIELKLGHESQLFLNNKTMVEARWPNVGSDLLKPELAAMDEGTTPELIVDSELPDWDYTGAQLWIHAPKFWSDWTTKVISFDRKSLQIENLAPYPGPSQHLAVEGADYFVFGILEALDSENEWYYDKEKQELYVYSENNKLPKEGYHIKTRMNVFELSDKAFIEIRNVSIIGAGIKTNENTISMKLDGLKMFYPYYSSQCNRYFGDQRGKGFTIRGKNCEIWDTEIAYSSGSGIDMLGEDNKLVNSYIHDTDFIGSYASCVGLAGKGNIISHCTLSRSGRTVIDYGGMYQALIQHCDMSHSGLLTSDLGLTYGNIISGGNSEVRYNLLHHNDDNHLDMGLYYDHATQNIISHHNIIWGIKFSAFHINHYAAYHLVYNNTFISKKHGFRSTWGNHAAPDLLECRFVNNLFAGPCETTAGNYYWNANITGYKDFDENKVMQAAAEGLGKGVYIEGISAIPDGTLPGVGAIEYQGMKFKAGHNFDNPPTNIDFERSKPKYRNLLENATFNKGDHFAPWQGNNESVIPIVHAMRSHTNDDTGEGRMGRNSVKLAAKDSEIFQIVDDIEPGNEYEFIGHLRVEGGETAILGVRFPDGTEFFSPQVTKSAPNWRRTRFAFNVPENVHSVEVFVRRLSDGKGDVFIDDFGLVLQ